MNLSALDIVAIAPLAMLVGVTLTMLVADLFGWCTNRLMWTLLACGSAWVCMLPQQLFVIQKVALSGLVYVDAFSWIFGTILLAGGCISFMLGGKLFAEQRAHTGIDVDVLMLLAIAGGLVMISSAHLIVLFLGFELLSICVYALTGIARHERASSEAALKYFILGAFSSAFLLYGMTLVYAATGSMSLPEIGLAATPENRLLLVGIGLIIFGFGFKVSLVPFHVWTPDVYQGAPSTITNFMAVVVKAAAFGSFLRLMYVAFGAASPVWSGLMWVLSALTMTMGNLVALRQKSVKRMLAYSSIAHAGYALIGFVVFGPARGAEATVFYMIVYSLMTAAAFGVVLLATASSDAQYGNDDIESLSGLGWSRPFLGFVMTIAMLSLAGMPPLAGFIGKFYLFRAAIEGGFQGLAIIAALNSVVSLYYYLGVLVVMYFKTERSVAWMPMSNIPFAPRLALGLVTAGTIILGVFGESALDAVEYAVQSMG